MTERTLAPRDPATPYEAWLLAIPNPGTRDAYAKAVRAYAAWRCVPEEPAVREFLSSSPAAHDLASRWRASMNSLSPHTVNNRLTALRALVKHCRRLGLLAWSLDVDSVRAPRELYPETNNYPRVLAVAVSLEDRALVRFLGDRGPRRGEVASALAEDFHDGDKPYILLRGKGYNGVKKAHALAPETAAALSAHLGSRRRGPIFQNAKGEAISGQALYGRIRRLAKAAGIVGRCHPHQFRHEFVDRALEATNGDIQSVSDAVGHAYIGTTHSYATKRGKEERSRSVAEAVALPEG